MTVFRFRTLDGLPGHRDTNMWDEVKGTGIGNHYECKSRVMTRKLAGNVSVN